MTQHQDFKNWWKENRPGEKPPSASERCKCGHKKERLGNTTRVCAKCGHEVLSYLVLQRGVVNAKTPV